MTLTEVKALIVAYSSKSHQILVDNPEGLTRLEWSIHQLNPEILTSLEAEGMGTGVFKCGDGIALIIHPGNDRRTMITLYSTPIKVKITYES